MATFKNIKIKMKNGKTRLQRVQVLASGRFKFVKNTSKAKSSTRKSPKKKATKRKSTTKKKTTQRRVKSMAKKKRSNGNKLSVTGLFRGAVYGLTAGSTAITIISRGDPDPVDKIAKAYAGLDQAGRFSFNQLKSTYTPVIIWSIIDLFASKFGVYKRAGQAIGKVF